MWRVNSGGQLSSPGQHDHASSRHDRWSPPRMNIGYTLSGAAGPEVACDTGALSLFQPSDPESLQAPPTVACEHARQHLTCQGIPARRGFSQRRW
jgi:hypothetical protein